MKQAVGKVVEKRGIAGIIPEGVLIVRQRLGRALDVLVTHSPPLGIHDRPDLPHTRFKVLLSLLRLFSPRYHLHGQLHIYRQDEVRETRFEETTVVNVYPYKVLEI